MDAARDTSPLPSRRISLETTDYTAFHPDPGTEPARAENCVGDQVLIGFHVYHASNPLAVSGFEAVCGAVTVTTGVAYDITIPLQSSLGLVGNGGTKVSLVCPANQAVVGFFGQASSLLNQLGVHCAPLMAAGDGRTVDAGTTTTPRGPAPAGTTATPFDQRCRSGHLAHGYVVHYGYRIAALSFHCARLNLVP